jgi:hypothetical protein
LAKLYWRLAEKSISANFAPSMVRNFTTEFTEITEKKLGHATPLSDLQEAD